MGAWITKAAQMLLKLLLLPFTFLVAATKKMLSGRLPRWAYVAIEFLTVVLVVTGLAALNWYLRLAQYLIGPPQLRHVWLGLVALLGYLTVRLMLLVVKLLPHRVPEYPDIAEAFSAGCDALLDARTGIQDAPLFLVLGTEASNERALVASSRFGDHIFGEDINAPLRFYGNRDGIWITVPGISSVSEQATRVTQNKESSHKQNEALRLTVAEKERTSARMAFLTRLLKKARGPVVPINGVVMAIPYSWLQDENLNQMADTVQIDMGTIQSQLGVKCLCQFVFRDIEESPGFSAFIEHVPAEEQPDQLGCTLPHFSVIGEDDVVPLHDSLQGLLRNRVYEAYQHNLDNPDNGKLYRLLDSFKREQAGFSNILSNAFAVDASERFYLGGVYFAALKEKSNAFVDGILTHLIREHDEMIAWNEHATRADRRYKHLSSLIAACVVVMLACDALTVGALVMSFQQQ